MCNVLEVNSVLDILVIGELNNYILVVTTKCEIHNFTTQELYSNEKLPLVGHPHLRVDEVWLSLLNNNLFTQTMQNFRNAFTMNYNNQECIFFLSYYDGIIFNINTKSVQKLDYFGINSEPVVVFSHWQQNTLIQWHNDTIIISKLSDSNPITLLSTDVLNLCKTHGSVSCSKSQCNKYQSSTDQLKQGFVTERNMYLMTTLKGQQHYVDYFDSKVLHSSDPQPMKSKSGGLFFGYETQTVVYVSSGLSIFLGIVLFLCICRCCCAKKNSDDKEKKDEQDKQPKKKASKEDRKKSPKDKKDVNRKKSTASGIGKQSSRQSGLAVQSSKVGSKQSGLAMQSSKVVSKQSSANNGRAKKRSSNRKVSSNINLNPVSSTDF